MATVLDHSRLYHEIHERDVSACRRHVVDDREEPTPPLLKISAPTHARGFKDPLVHKEIQIVSDPRRHVVGDQKPTPASTYAALEDFYAAVKLYVNRIPAALVDQAIATVVDKQRRRASASVLSGCPVAEPATDSINVRSLVSVPSVAGTSPTVIGVTAPSVKPSSVRSSTLAETVVTNNSAPPGGGSDESNDDEDAGAGSRGRRDLRVVEVLCATYRLFYQIHKKIL